MDNSKCTVTVVRWMEEEDFWCASPAYATNWIASIAAELRIRRVLTFTLTESS